MYESLVKEYFSFLSDYGYNIDKENGIIQYHQYHMKVVKIESKYGFQRALMKQAASLKTFEEILFHYLMHWNTPC